MATSAQPRVSARIGCPVDLTVTFYNNGVPENPFAVRRVDIYAGSVKDENIVAMIPILDPDDPDYPLPLTNPSPGVFTLAYDVPCDFETNLAYFDVWEYIGTEACAGGSDVDLEDESLWQSSCNKFFVFPEGFFVDDGLIIPQFGFEALDLHFRKGEVRTLRVGITPLPLYDFDYNLVAPMIPQITPTITIETTQCELLVDAAPGRMGLRQGLFRTNPFEAQFTLDTSQFLKGTYLYRVTLPLPNGETRISPSFRFTIS